MLCIYWRTCTCSANPHLPISHKNEDLLTASHAGHFQCDCYEENEALFIIMTQITNYTKCVLAPNLSGPDSTAWQAPLPQPEKIATLYVTGLLVLYYLLLVPVQISLKPVFIYPAQTSESEFLLFRF